VCWWDRPETWPRQMGGEVAPLREHLLCKSRHRSPQFPAVAQVKPMKSPTARRRRRNSTAPAKLWGVSLVYVAGARALHVGSSDRKDVGFPLPRNAPGDEVATPDPRQ
jgi:hypothetical protein